MQTCFDFHQNITLDHVCMLAVDTLNTRCDKNVHCMIHQNIL